MAEDSAHVDPVSDKEEEEQKRPSKPPCEVCGSQPWKYRCPKCSKLTCCLDCVKRHKVETQCDGQRDPTVYVAMKDMNNTVLLSDYRFLEDQIRKLDAAKREERHSKTRMPKFLHFVGGAARRRNIDLCLMPPTFSRHHCNSTFFNIQRQTLYWHVEWDFSDTGIKYEECKQSEDLTLASLLAKYLDPKTSDPVIRHRLQSYGTRSLGSLEEVLSGCKLLLRNHNTPDASPCYFELRPDLSLSANLYGKRLLEYPTILVVKKGSGQQYRLSPPCFPDEEVVRSWKTWAPKPEGPKRRRTRNRPAPWHIGKRRNAVPNMF